MNDSISNIRLAEVNPRLAGLINSVANKLAMEGIYFRVAQGLRKASDQAALWALGRTVLTKPDGSPQGIVTHAPPGHSWHEMGMAVDCFPFLLGASGALEMNNPAIPVFQSMIRAMKAAGLVAGADWPEPKKDSPHFQLPGIPVSPTDADRAAFASGGLDAVWKLYL